MANRLHDCADSLMVSALAQLTCMRKLKTAALYYCEVLGRHFVCCCCCTFINLLLLLLQAAVSKEDLEGRRYFPFTLVKAHTGINPQTPALGVKHVYAACRCASAARRGRHAC